MYKRIVIILIVVLSIQIVYSQMPKTDINQPKVDIPKTDEQKNLTKALEDAKKSADKFKLKKEKLPPPKGPVVAFLPFNYTYAVGESKALIAQNEIAVAMVKSQLFTPASLKKWADKRFKDGDGRDIHYILNQMRIFKVPAEFVCHGYVFKSGNEYGVRIALYPVNGMTPVTYYFRTFSYFTDIPKIATQILQEMKLRIVSQKFAQTGKKILINNFELNYLFYTRSETGETNISPLPFIKLNGVEYKKEDFFNELLLYNFHISNLYTVFNNNIKDYTLNSRYNGTIAYDYIINAKLDISKELKKCTLEVYSTGNKPDLLFSKIYRFESLSLTKLYYEMRKWVKDITLTLLNDEELKKTGEAELDSLYSNEDIFLENCYIGRGNQSNLIVPISASNIKIWLGETAFTDKFLTPASYKENYINIKPYKSGISKSPQSFFKVSVGLNLLAGFYFHPQYNEKQQIIFHNTINDKYKYFNLGDILYSPAIGNDLNDQFSYFIGLGFDLTLENKYFLLTNALNIKGGHYSNTIEFKPEKDIDINSAPISNLNINYSLLKVNITVDYNFLAAFMIFNVDNPFRLYAGAGGFISFWYNYYNETIKGSGTIDSLDYVLDNKIEQRQSINMILGLFPEVGIIFKYSKFNFKIGTAYYFDLYKYNITTNTEYGNLEQFNTSGLFLKFTFGIYIK